MSIQNYSNKKGITVAELKKVIAEWPETDGYGEPREVWLCTGFHLSSPVKHLEILNRRVHEDDTVSSDLLISPGVDHEWEHDEEITKLRADLETYRGCLQEVKINASLVEGNCGSQDQGLKNFAGDLLKAINTHLSKI